MLLIQGADVYTPAHIGIRDILISEGKIAAIGEALRMDTNAVTVEILDARGRMAVPGYIDQHVHVIGGGGEAGPYSRTPEVQLSDIIAAGVTTVIGVLGTDGTTRHLESLLAKVRALETEGISAYMLTGSYEIPVQSITGDPRRDIIVIDKILGIGEIAISDHRSSQPTKDELKRILTQARVGGMLAGKGGVVQFHLGVGSASLQMLFEILEETEIPARHLIPTHINRTPELLEQGMAFAKRGGYIDLTSGIRPSEGFDLAVPPAKALRLCAQAGVPMDRITMSSDGNGSMAECDETGAVKRLLVTKLHSLHEEVRNAIVREGLPVEDALAVVTQNVAKANGLFPNKGSLCVGGDADILLLDSAFEMDSVIARGRMMVQARQILARGTFEA